MAAALDRPTASWLTLLLPLGSNKTLKNCPNGMNLEAHGLQHILANIVREVSRRTDAAVRAVNGTRGGPSISDSW